MAITLQQMRTSVRTSMLADNNRWSDAAIDQGILTVLEDFVQQVRPSIFSGTVPLNGTTFQQAITFSDFRPNRAVRYEIKRFDVQDDRPGRRLRVENYDHVAREIEQHGTVGTTGDPSAIAFRTHDKPILDRMPGTVWPEMRVTFFESLRRFEPGASGTTTVNLPDEYLQTPMWYGAAAVLQHNDPAARFSDPSWQKYEVFKARIQAQEGVDVGEMVMNEDRYL